MPVAYGERGGNHRMQQTDGVAVLATHIAHTDRRALSQAWFSALHLAERTPPAPRSRAPRAALASGGAARAGRDPHAAAPRRPPTGAPGLRGTERDTGARTGAMTGGADRRAPKSDLARRIERGLRHAPARGATAFTVRGAGGRVQLVVRGDGARTRVVAVCAPPLRERVERALAHARFALAGRGVRAEVA
jgi:hypothetical protein